jgi:hypothetical protein
VEDETTLANRRKPEEAARANQVRLNNYAQQPSMRVKRRVFAHIGRIGNRVRNKKMSADQRSAHARMMALARWRNTSARRMKKPQARERAGAELRIR